MTEETRSRPPAEARALPPAAVAIYPEIGMTTAAIGELVARIRGGGLQANLAEAVALAWTAAGGLAAVFIGRPVVFVGDDGTVIDVDAKEVKSRRHHKAESMAVDLDSEAGAAMLEQCNAALEKTRVAHAMGSQDQLVGAIKLPFDPGILVDMLFSAVSKMLKDWLAKQLDQLAGK